MSAARMTSSTSQEREVKILAIFGCLHLPVIAAICLLLGQNIIVFASLSAVLCLVPLAMLRLNPQAAKISIAINLVAQASLITASLAGHPWQVDSHMYFFAIIAVLSTLVDIRALLAATALIAVHHLTLNFLLSSLIYPGGASILRTVFHAVILIIESTALILMTHFRLELTAAAETDNQRARQAEQRAQQALTEMEAASARSETEREELMKLMEQEFTALVSQGVEGRFGSKITRSFDNERMNKLAESLNALFAAIAETLGDIQQNLSSIASGDLSHSMDKALRGQFEELRQGVNGSVASLRGMIGDVQSAVVVARANTSEINNEAAALAQRNEKQAARVQETSATMEQLTETVSANSKRLDEAESLARHLTDRTDEGSRAVSRAVSAVGRIQESSGRITEIISVIESIAFQTNLLALNAAVEAARAGEAGKGFAVVASEVRTLAQRSSEAARDISVLIEATTSSVSQGVEMVEQTGTALGLITESLDALAGTISQIANSGREQFENIAEMRDNIRDMDGNIQSNASMASRSAAAAQALDSNISQLSAIAEKFRLEQEEATKTFRQAV
ncbi:methyl-accepting chemotaxis protein [Algicella marina]|uniref:Methyl-accepting chemotaxis protein n=1 Tax=Algicella marina TaxID=2683284 RepID=A0A6P1SX59_9RHOB|nr:methyl-accepting chemotaxis protein [Algicella marina]QHQ33923.1 hypothetical protein GO499_01365 [Algicella marina]